MQSVNPPCEDQGKEHMHNGFGCKQKDIILKISKQKSTRCGERSTYCCETVYLLLCNNRLTADLQSTYCCEAV